MPCSNCYNGCTEIVSDKCVKYTGVDVPVLGIQSGDSLSYVEQALIEFLTSTLDGTGIVPLLGDIDICEVVQKYLPDCDPITLNDVLKALIQAACDLQVQVDAVVAELATLNADYNVDCLDGVTNSSDTHAVLQAVIDKLCQLEVDLTALSLDLSTNYVKLSELDSLIQNYLDSIDSGSGGQYYLRMVPYTVVEYYGPLSNFDGSGAGIAANGFDKIYLCNGANGTPDKRGRLPVGAIQSVPGGGALDPVVDPGFPGNYNYALYSLNGANTVTLLSTQIPSHTHSISNTVSVTDHTHFTVKTGDQISLTSTTPIAEIATYGGNTSYVLAGAAGVPTIGLTSPSKSTVNIASTIGSTGGSQAHTNVPPVLACYYIMYIP